MGFKIKSIQPTPNPNAAKFILDREISSHPISFLTPEQAQDHPIAKELFDINGVASVLILGDFVTINKVSDRRWDLITGKVEEILKKCS
jgi:hypothetical protein